MQVYNTIKVKVKLVTIKVLQNIISKKPDIFRIIYANNLHRIYELGKAMMVVGTFGYQPHIKGIIYLPKIMMAAPYPMYNLYTALLIGLYTVGSKFSRLILYK